MTLPISLVAGVVVARLLGPSERGLFSFLQLLGAFLLPVATFGLGASVTYLVSTRRKSPSEVIVPSMAVGALQGLALGAIVLICWRAGLLGDAARSIPQYIILIAVCLLPIQGAFILGSRVPLGDSWFSLSNALTLLQPIIQSALLLGLVALMHYGLAGAMGSILLTHAFLLAILAVGLWRRYRPACSPLAPFLREAVPYGVRVWLGDLTVRANLRLDQFLLGIWGSASELGVYAIAVNLTELLWLAPDSFAIVLFNRIASSANDQERLALIERVHRATFAAMVILAAVVASLGGAVIRLAYGQAYAPAYEILLLLLPGTVAMTTVKLLTKYYSGIGAPGQSSLIQVVGAIASAVLYAALIPRGGAVAAAVASSVGYTASAVAGLALYPNRARIGALFAVRPSDLAWVIERLGDAVRRKKLAARAGVS